MTRPIDRLAARGVEVPEPVPPKGAYLAVRQFGGTAWVSGCTGRSTTAGPLAGVVGDTLSLEQAREEAERAATNLVVAVENSVGLDAVAAVLHLRGFVRATPDFGAHPKVLDAASALLADIFGPEVGVHARTALGVHSLPGQACVELEAVLALRQ